MTSGGDQKHLASLRLCAHTFLYHITSQQHVSDINFMHEVTQLSRELRKENKRTESVFALMADKRL